MSDSVYMGKHSYDALEEAGYWINNVESDIAEISAVFGALYPDNGRSVTKQDFMDALNAFEISQRRLLEELDKFIAD